MGRRGRLLKPRPCHSGVLGATAVAGLPWAKQPRYSGPWCASGFLYGLVEAAESESEALERARLANQSGDFAASVAIYQDWSQRGSTAATRFFGLMYWSGYGVAKDRRRACDLYAEAEKKADPGGTELLGDCYFHGDGRPQDYSRSAALYARTSEVPAL